jgi:phosphoribosyl 1,2-cyclic phosphodiesterase
LKLIFLGTRGNIEVRTPLHRCHSALMIAHDRKQVMIDCGADWAGKLRSLSPDALLLTHAHPDHAFGLREGARCPIFATEATWKEIGAFPITDRRVIRPRAGFEVAGIRVEAFPVVHSQLAPAVGFQVNCGSIGFFYVPDVVEIEERRDALAGVQLYIGDGARLTRPLVRHSDGYPIGHTSIRTHLGWCEEAGITRAVFTHCGTEVARADPDLVDEEVSAMGVEHRLSAAVAFDGLQLSLH